MRYLSPCSLSSKTSTTKTVIQNSSSFVNNWKRKNRNIFTIQRYASSSSSIRYPYNNHKFINEFSPCIHRCYSSSRNGPDMSSVKQKLGQARNTTGSKPRRVYVCGACGMEHTRWQGQCSSCKEWNTIEEQYITSSSSPTSSVSGGGGGSILSSISSSSSSSSRSLSSSFVDNRAESLTLSEAVRGEGRSEGGEVWDTGLPEMDRVLGDGLHGGTVVMVGGVPGVGKSTLVLQVLGHLGRTAGPVVYYSGEEAVHQVAARAKRMGIDRTASDMHFMPEGDLEGLIGVMEKVGARAVVVDSIQTIRVDSNLGGTGGGFSFRSGTQVMALASVLKTVSKALDAVVIVTGQVTKEGSISGPHVIEHMVDAVLYFDNPQGNHLRVLRSHKNRFGPTNEIGLFEMQQNGLISVHNSDVFIRERAADVSGSVVAPLLDGSRPILVEVQALTTPRKKWTNLNSVFLGCDINRVWMMATVLEQKLGFKASHLNLMVNVVGGLKTRFDLASDLAVLAALLSTILGQSPKDHRSVFMGEVGLAGEVRSVFNAKQRILETTKLGFTTIFLPYQNFIDLRREMDKETFEKITWFPLRKARELIWKAFNPNKKQNTIELDDEI